MRHGRVRSASAACRSLARRHSCARRRAAGLRGVVRCRHHHHLRQRGRVECARARVPAGRVRHDRPGQAEDRRRRLLVVPLHGEHAAARATSRARALPPPPQQQQQQQQQQQSTAATSGQQTRGHHHHRASQGDRGRAHVTCESASQRQLNSVRGVASRSPPHAQRLQHPERLLPQSHPQERLNSAAAAAATATAETTTTATAAAAAASTARLRLDSVHEQRVCGVRLAVLN